jgi:hypothetical protein
MRLKLRFGIRFVKISLLTCSKTIFEAVKGGVNEIGQVLDQYYVKTDLYEENELPNEPIILN